MIDVKPNKDICEAGNCEWYEDIQHESCWGCDLSSNNNWLAEYSEIPNDCLMKLEYIMSSQDK